MCEKLFKYEFALKINIIILLYLTWLSFCSTVFFFLNKKKKCFYELLPHQMDFKRNTCLLIRKIRHLNFSSSLPVVEAYWLREEKEHLLNSCKWSAKYRLSSKQPIERNQWYYIVFFFISKSIAPCNITQCRQLNFQIKLYRIK